MNFFFLVHGLGRGQVAAAPPRTQRDDMDSIKGAIELRALLEKQGVAIDEERCAPSDVPDDAPPVFHWLGGPPAAETSRPRDD